MTPDQAAALWGAAYHDRLKYYCGNYTHTPAGDAYTHEEARRYADAVVEKAQYFAPHTGPEPEGGDTSTHSGTTPTR